MRGECGKVTNIFLPILPIITDRPSALSVIVSIEIKEEIITIPKCNWLQEYFGVLGAVGVGAFFFVQNLVSRGSIGLGDAKLGALVGAVTGAGPTGANLGAVYAVIAGVFIGGATALVLLVTRVRGLKDPIPYGPFLWRAQRSSCTSVRDPHESRGS